MAIGIGTALAIIALVICFLVFCCAVNDNGRVALYAFVTGLAVLTLMIPFWVTW